MRLNYTSYICRELKALSRLSSGPPCDRRKSKLAACGNPLTKATYHFISSGKQRQGFCTSFVASAKKSGTSKTAITLSRKGEKSTTMRNQIKDQKLRPRILVVGAGWAGLTFVRGLTATPGRECPFDITIVSPARTAALTPLLASAACGMFDADMAEETIRRWGWNEEGVANSNESAHEHRATASGTLTKYQANVSSIDFERKIARCEPVFERGGVPHQLLNSDKDEVKSFEVAYDKIVLCPGHIPNTFGTPGVTEHAIFLNSVSEALLLRSRILDCLEAACLPTSVITPEQRRSMLHFAIVGGGPTGVEVAAELDELMQQHLRHMYPKRVMDDVRISIWDVKEELLDGVMSASARRYAMDRFAERHGVEMKVSRTIKRVGPGWIESEEDGRVNVGCIVWAVGGRIGELIESLDCGKVRKGGRVVTDSALRILRENPSDRTQENHETTVNPNLAQPRVFEDAFALGDAADIWTSSHPPTAEVAVQKAKWLAEQFVSRSDSSEQQNALFHFVPAPQKAYLGRFDGVMEGKQSQWNGTWAWLAWRKGNLDWNQGWRRKLMMVIYWLANWVDGREVARRR